MNPRIKQLRDLVVALDLADRNLRPLAADAYRDAARLAQRLTREEMGLLPMGDFAGPVNSLQNIAENIYFVSNGCFADLDGTGRAPVARLEAAALIGRMRATSQDQQVAGLMGIDINRVISLTFIIGAGLGAVAGVMIGSYYGIAHYQMGFILGLKAFSAAVLGGIGNLGGAMLGGLLLGLIEAMGAGYIGDLTNLCQLANWSDALARRCADDANLTLFGSNYQDVFAFLVLIAVLIFRPSGLLGERVSDRA